MLADVSLPKTANMTLPKMSGAQYYFRYESFSLFSVTKIRVYSLIDAVNLRRTTLHRTDIYRNLSLLLALEMIDLASWVPLMLDLNDFREAQFCYSCYCSTFRTMRHSSMFTRKTYTAFQTD